MTGRVLSHRHSLKRYLEWPDMPGLMAYRSPASGYWLNSESVIAKRAVVMNNVPSSSPPKQQLVGRGTGIVT